MCIFTLFALLLSHRFTLYAYSEINKFAQDKVNQTVNNTEFVFKTVRNYALKIYSDSDVSNWIYAKNSDPIQDMMTFHVLNDYTISNPFIKKVYLFNMKTERVMDSAVKCYDFGDFPDRNIMEELHKSKDPYKPYFEYNSSGASFIAMTIPQSYSINDYNGYLVVIFDKNVLENYLLSNYAGTGINIVILDDRGKPVLGSEQDELLEQSWQLIDQRENGNFRVKAGKDTWICNFSRLNMQNWTVCHFVSAENIFSDVVSFQNLLILSTTALLLVLLVIAYLNSLKTFKLYNNVNSLKDSIKDSRLIVMAEHLRQWILCGYKDQIIEKYILENSDLLKYRHICLCVIRMESYTAFSEKYDFKTRRMIKADILNKAKEFIRDEGYGAEGVDLDGDHVVLLIGKDAKEEDTAICVLKKINTYIEREKQIRAAISINCCEDFNEDLRTIYQNAYEFTMLKFIWGFDKIYTHEDYENYIRIQKSVKDQDLTYESLTEKIINKIYLGKLDPMDDLLEDLTNQMQFIPYEQCKFQVKLFVYKIVQCFNRMTDLNDYNGISGLVDSFATLNDLKLWLQNGLMDICAQIGDQKVSKRKDDAVQEIVEYINNHLNDPMLSIDEIAAHISLSAGYVRHIFKDNYNTTLSDYLLDQRVENVKKLLAETDWSVLDIAERSGFQTRSHFFTVFKKATGMTPTQFREAISRSSGVR